MPTIALRLLGAFALTSDGAPLEGFAQPRLQALVAYLALHRRTPVLRAQLAAALWPETNDEQALKNLRTLLARLRAAMPEADALLAADALTLQWRPGTPGTLVAGRTGQSRRPVRQPANTRTSSV